MMYQMTFRVSEHALGHLLKAATDAGGTFIPASLMLWQPQPAPEPEPEQRPANKQFRYVDGKHDKGGMHSDTLVVLLLNEPPLRVWSLAELGERFATNAPVRFAKSSAGPACSNLAKAGVIRRVSEGYYCSLGCPLPDDWQPPGAAATQGRFEPF